MTKKPVDVDVNRRNFFKKGLLGTGAIILAGFGISSAVKNEILPTSRSDIINGNKSGGHVPDDPKHHWGFMIDLSKCDGCVNLDPPEEDPTGERPRCSFACRKYHNFLGAELPQYWIRVYKLEGTEGVDKFFFPKPCQNCQDAPCKRVCPTGATYQRKDGTVLINHDICIGCRICMAACPYETRFFWYNDPPERTEFLDVEYTPEHLVVQQKGTVVKCDLCIHLVYNNQVPHCVSACPQGALYYGDLNEDTVSNGRELLSLHTTLNNRAGYRYKEGEGTKPSVYYLPKIAINKLSASIEVEIQPQSQITRSVNVKVEDEHGQPVRYGTVIIEKDTNFGTLFLGQGTTTRQGTCTIEISIIEESQVRVRLREDEKYLKSEVVKVV